MSNRKSLSRVVLAMVVGGLTSGPAIAGTTLECTDETKALHEYVAEQATPQPGEVNGAPTEAVAENRAGSAVLPDGAPAETAPRARKNAAGMGL